MADDIGFSGPGAPDLSVNNSDNPSQALPVFFEREGNDKVDREISPQTVSTAKEEAARLDAIAGNDDGAAEQTAPRL